MALDTALGELNDRLKAGQHRCCVERRGGSLYLRATLPIREAQGHRRQRIALGLPATYASLPEAERQAIELSHQLRTASFTWTAWDKQAAPNALPVAQFRDLATQLHARQYRDSPERGHQAWIKKWTPALRKLPSSGGITPEVLVRALRRLPEGSAGRLSQGTILAQIAKAAGLDPEPVKAAARGYGVAALNPREIPTDPEIEDAWDRLRLPHWRWTWGMCATFGLRPHEVAGVEWLPDNWIRVADTTKTGGRTVTACPSAWIDRFELQALPRPTGDRYRISQLLGDALRTVGVPIRTYSLRHAFALRLMSRGVPPELGARLMGHSLQMHEATYKRWLSADHLNRSMARFNL